MQFIKILLWVLLLVASFIFWWTNETRSSLDLGAAVVESRVSTFTLGAFIIGFLPLWLIHRATKWRLTRRIKTLEAAALPAPVQSPAQSPAPVSVKDVSAKKTETDTPAVSPLSGDDTPNDGAKTS